MFDDFRLEAHELIPRGNHVVVPCDGVRAEAATACR